MKASPIRSNSIIIEVSSHFVLKNPPSEILKAFSYEIKFPEKCVFCENKVCQACLYKPKIEHSYLVSKEDPNIVLIPTGRLAKAVSIIKQAYKELGYKNIFFDDRRNKALFDKDDFFVFTGTLRDYQDKACKEWAKAKGGIIQAPPRSGKTVMAVYIVSKVRRPTIILAHKRELLVQFENSFKKFTNVSKMEVLLGKRILYYADEIKKRWDWFETQVINKGHPYVILSTIQLFHSEKNREFLKKLAPNIGLVVVDECHHIGAPVFKTIVSMFWNRFYLGLSATPKRKDKKDQIIYDIIGDISSRVNPPTLKCIVYVIYTKVSPGNFKRWDTFLKRISLNEKRNKLILKLLKKDYDEGRNILVLVSYKSHLNVLLEECLKRKIEAYEFSGSVPKHKREKILEQARKGKIRCIIATRNMAQEGLDVPSWDTLYLTTPLANKYGILQEVSRIRTYVEGKKPIVRYFLDDHSAAYACFRIAESVFKQEGFEIKRVFSA